MKNRKFTHILGIISSIGRVTFQEIIRDKILYNIFLFAVLLFGLGFLASNLTFIRPQRVILDFGLSAINISLSMIAVFIGAGMIGREFERRTIFVALSRPISRLDFVIGKFAGLSLVLAANWILFCLVFFGILSTEGGWQSTLLHPTLMSALAMLYLQSLVMAAIAILFSTVSTASLSAFLTVGFYLVGNNISQIRLVATKSDSPLTKMIFNGLANLLPNLEHFNLGLKVTYSLPVTGTALVFSFFYCLALVALALLAAGWFVQERET